MKLAIMQPYFFPYIGYFQLINIADRFVICDDVNFIKGGWINRNYLLIHGEKHLFSLPIKNKSQNKLINELQILFDNKDKMIFLKKVKFSYKKAPYFKSVNTLISEIILCEETNLANFVGNSIRKICKYLGINENIVFSSMNYEKDGLKGQDRVLDICLKEKADTYINPIGGTSLYKKNDFAQKNIKLFFLKTGNIEYKQFTNEFVNDLSIVDVLMFNNKKQINKFLNNYKLI